MTELLKVKNTLLKVPVLIQPGQAKQSIGLALGYGKVKGIKEEMQVGVNAFKFYNNFNPVLTIFNVISKHFMQNISIPQDEKTTVDVSNLTVALADLQ